MTNQETDINIAAFLDEWYSIDTQNMESILKLGLTREILSIISKEYSSKKKNKLLLDYRNSGRIFWSIKKIFWFFLWSLKWIINLQKDKDKKILLVAIGSNLNNIDVYLEQLIVLAKNNNCVIVLLNLIESYKHLISNQLFYYPRFFYVKGHIANKKTINGYAYDIVNSINTLSVKNKIRISLNVEHLIKPIKQLLWDHAGFSYLVSKLICPSRIVGLIQDYDYTYNKYIYYKIASQNLIKTLTLDNSLHIYQHLYKKTFSDYHFVWGEYKKKIILKNNLISPLKIQVVGKPLKVKKNYKDPKKKSDLWVYIAQAYTDPSMFISGRDYKSLEFNIKILSNYQKKYYPNDNFVLKIHPADKSPHFKVGISKSFKGSIHALVNNARIIFVEDSTLAVELFANNSPIVYILDRFGNDNIGLVNRGLIPGINVNGDFDKIIKSILSERTIYDEQENRNILDYYFDHFDEKNFQNTIGEILFHNSG